MWSNFWKWLSPETREILRHVVGGSLIILVVSVLALLLEALGAAAHQMGASKFAVATIELLANAALIADALVTSKYLLEGVWHAFMPWGPSIGRVVRPLLKMTLTWYTKRWP
jgi:hypothetical protein